MRKHETQGTPPKPLEAFENRDHRQECQLRYITADEARLRSFGCTCPKPLESPQEIEQPVTLREAYEYFMGPQACGDFTCICNDPEHCGICEMRMRTEATLAREPKPVPQAEGPRRFPPSTCVECGRVIPPGQVQKCELTRGGYCSHHIPKALYEYIEQLPACVKGK